MSKNKPKDKPGDMFATVVGMVSGIPVRSSWFNELAKAIAYANANPGIEWIEEVGVGCVWKRPENRKKVVVDIPSEQDNPTGFHRRYIVLKADGTPMDPNAVNFTLRLDQQGDDNVHTRACRIAALAYADAVEDTHLQQVGRELKELVKKLE